MRSLIILSLSLSLLLLQYSIYAYSKEIVDKDHLLYYPIAEKKLDKYFNPKFLVYMEDYGIYTVRPRKNEWMIREVAVSDLRDFQSYCQNETWRRMPVRSGYRSYYEQSIAYSNYKEDWGSALPWTSEHQLWLSVDFGFNNSFLDSYDFPKLAKCFRENAHRFGFVLSYGIWNPHYIYEPWHFRYVWKKYAGMIYDQWLWDSAWIFLENPWEYLNEERAKHLAILRERKKQAEDKKIADQKDAYFWNIISWKYNLSEDMKAMVFLKWNLINLLAKWDRDNFYEYSCAYRYLQGVNFEFWVSNFESNFN